MNLPEFGNKVRRSTHWIATIILAGGCAGEPLTPEQQTLCSLEQEGPSERPIERTNPQYPAHAATNGIEGWAEVRGDVGPDGYLQNVFVEKSTPPNVFDWEALRAFSKWRFCPPAHPDAPPRSVHYRFEFKIPR